MEIHRDDNGVAVDAVCGKNVGDFDLEGHEYHVHLGSNEGIVIINFQNGPVPTNGINGLTNESLLAILIHRTNVLNNKFPCDENASAIAYMEGALAKFELRTAKRETRGVEGKEIE